jgi:hypothetical protein
MGIPPNEEPTALRIVARMTERAMADIAGADATMNEKMDSFKRLIDEEIAMCGKVPERNA